MEAHQPLLVKGQEEHEEEDEEEEEEVTLLGRRSLRRTYDQNGSGDDQLGSSLTTSDISDSSKSSGCFREGGDDMEKGDKPSLDRELANENMEVEKEEQQQQQMESGNDTVGSGSVYFDKDQGSDCIYQHSEELRCSVVEPSNFDPSPGDANILTNNADSLLKEIDNNNGKILENKGFSGSNLALLEQSPARHEVEEDAQIIEATTTEDFDLIEEIDREETEFDVDKVLEKQNTHDLYCPNCHSCITRRVILRRRERKVRYIHRKKCDKRKTISELETNTNYIVSNDEEHHQDNGVDVFRCLSCLSFFIPIGNGFKLFKTSKSKPENEDLQLRRNVTSASTSWPFSIFTSDNKKSKTEEGLENDVPQESGVDTSVSAVGEDTANAVVGQRNKSDEATDKATLDGDSMFHETADADKQYSSLTSLNAMDKHLENSHSVASLVGTGYCANSAAIDCETLNNVKIWEISPAVASQVDSLGKPVEVTSMGPKQDGKHSSSSLTSESSAIEHSDQMIDKDPKVTGGIEEPAHVSATIGSAVLENANKESGQTALGAVSTDPKAAVGVEESVYVSQASSTIHTHQTGMDVSTSPKIGIAVEKVKIDNGEQTSSAAEKEITGSRLIVVVETGQPEPAASQRLQDTGIPTDIRISSQTETSMQGSSQRVDGVGIDILKSIVYGGLIESITSLGVVSSAAGAGASTLNILALGLANLIGGLFIVCHNLVDLKNEVSTRSSYQTDQQVDRYQELLGQRANFSLHATITILSYLIFGLLPPIIYGFSYQKSDNVDYKLAAVGCASLICIVLLAIGKAHVQRQPRHYIRTVMYYVVTGIMASGASFVAGDLIDKLLEKLGWTELSWAVTLESKQPERSWSSY